VRLGGACFGGGGGGGGLLCCHQVEVFALSPCALVAVSVFFLFLLLEFFFVGLQGFIPKPVPVKDFFLPQGTLLLFVAALNPLFALPIVVLFSISNPLYQFRSRLLRERRITVLHRVFLQL